MKLELSPSILRSRDEDAERKQVEAVAPFLLGALLPASRTMVQLPELGVNGLPPPSANPWQASRTATGPEQSGVGLTGEDHVGQGGVDHVGQGGAEQRMVLRVDAGDLGTIGVVVERSAEGIRLVLAVENAAAASAADLERISLVSSLQASGLKVAGISIVQTDRFGTVLAENGSAARFTKNAGFDGDSELSEAHKSRRGSRRLDTAG